MSGISHALRLARIDVTRMARKHTDRDGGLGSLVSTGVFVLVLAAATLGGGYLAYRGGDALVAGDLTVPPNAIGVLRGIIAVLGLVLSVVVVVRGVGQRGTLVNAEGVLTTVPTREALTGLLVSEFVYVLLWLGGPTLGIGAGLALGTGVGWPLLTLPAGVAAIGVTAVAVGYPVGLGIRHFVTRFRFVARNKGVLIVAVFLVYFALVVTGTLNRTIVALFDPLQDSPAGWFADLLVLGVPGVDATPLRALGALGLTVGLAVIGIVAGTRLAALHWFSDPALAGETETDDERSSTATAEPGLERRLAPYLGVPTAALVVLAWRRAARAPLKLLYAAYPLLFVVGWIADIVQTGEVPPALAVGTVVFVTWAAGVIFTLNPLGDQGAGLPPTLLSRVDGRRFVHAHLLASLIVAIPAGVVLTAIAVTLSPLDTTNRLLLVVSAPVLMVVASALSVGIGMAFPRFQAVNVTRSVKTVIPSLLAFLLFTLHLLGTATSAAIVYDDATRGLAAFVLSWLLPFGLAIDAATLAPLAAATLIGLAIVPVISYRYAVRRFDTYTLE
ncbi:MAG: hypothetical protein V5A41_02305 [Haloarculaceae archaeon]